jgi:NADPH:quinone reductase-like Zn-dependent oxidoreductase
LDRCTGAQQPWQATNRHSRHCDGPRRVFEEMNQSLETLKVRPVIDAVYPFDEALEAYEHLYRGSFGKIVIRVRD